jgi:hypothetical protein
VGVARPEDLGREESEPERSDGGDRDERESPPAERYS